MSWHMRHTRIQIYAEEKYAVFTCGCCGAAAMTEEGLSFDEVEESYEAFYEKHKYCGLEE